MNYDRCLAEQLSVVDLDDDLADELNLSGSYADSEDDGSSEQQELNDDGTECKNLHVVQADLTRFKVMVTHCGVSS